MEIVITLLLFVFVCLQFTLFLSLVNRPKQILNFTSDEQLPFVSILIAARNEEQNIINCLKSIEQLNYPKNKLEVIIGNDQSTDNTANLVNEFIFEKPQYRLIDIHTRMGNAKAKANVLAHLFKISKGNIIFITDADITIKPTWISSILPHFKNNKIGIVSGTTIVKGNSFFAKMQSLDWLYFSGLLIAFDNLGLKSTAVGNNMAITKEAYEATKGYENFNFSVTEDLALFLEVRKKGYETINLLEHKNINFSASQNSLINLLHQRKRWLIGAQDLSIKWKLIFLLMALFYPLLFVLFCISLKNAVALWLCKISIQSIIAFYIAYQSKMKLPILHLIVFEIYLILSSFLISIFYILPIKMNWKERTF